MILCVGEMLDEGRLAELRQRLAARTFVDGAATAGWHAKLVAQEIKQEEQKAHELEGKIIQVTSVLAAKSGVL